MGWHFRCERLAPFWGPRAHGLPEGSILAPDRALNLQPHLCCLSFAPVPPSALQLGGDSPFQVTRSLSMPRGRAQVSHLVTGKCTLGAWIYFHVYEGLGGSPPSFLSPPLTCYLPSLPVSLPQNFFPSSHGILTNDPFVSQDFTPGPPARLVDTTNPQSPASTRVGSTQ